MGIEESTLLILIKIKIRYANGSFGLFYLVQNSKQYWINKLKYFILTLLDLD